MSMIRIVTLVHPSEVLARALALQNSPALPDSDVDGSGDDVAQDGYSVFGDIQTVYDDDSGDSVEEAETATDLDFQWLKDLLSAAEQERLHLRSKVSTREIFLC
ncbi:hypothetical protein GN958_ATG07205 [Phytophthora infestans]|uniref:Uncharacterized protein n=1 Tax=Phytophthora infestans TaxID=4787 RepID=A0A8S9UW20_PHYIN|nr:hypothetical protein GN958_ATG07205 [Phytophthora infestans]